MTSTGAELSLLGTSELVDRFVESAKAMGDPLGMPRRGFREGPEFDAAVATMQACGKELRSRGAKAAVRPLLFDQDPRVRFLAGAQFEKFDPDLALAAYHSIRYGLSTEDAVELKRRALATPARAPDISCLGIDALVAAFVESTTRLYATRMLELLTTPENMEFRNRILGETWNIMRRLKALGALDQLLPLLEDPNPVVRAQAAIACLKLDPTKAAGILERVAANESEYLEMGDAQHALENWRAGKPVIWGLD